MTQEAIYEMHRKMREAEQARERKYQEKRDQLIEMLELQGSFPITQHPDYEQDTAFDIDDIIELLENQKEQATACAHCGGAL